METEATPNGEGEQTAKWLKALRDRLEAIEDFECGFNPDEGNECLPWLQKIEQRFAKKLFPTARLDKLDVPSPERVGAVLGHQCAMMVWLFEQLNPSDAVQWQTASLSAAGFLDDDIVAQATPEQLSRRFDALRELARFALNTSIDQDYDCMSSFLLGFAKAFAKKPPAHFTAVARDTFSTDHLVLLRWREVASLSSVTEFDRFVCAASG